MNGVLENPSAPYSQEAEEAVLGCLMIDIDAVVRVSMLLSVEDFFMLRHQYIYTAILRLHGQQMPIDSLTLAEELSNMRVLEDVGGRIYLIRLMNNTPTSIYAEVYAEMVQRMAQRRRLLEAADSIRALALNEDIALETVLAQSESAVMAISTAREISRRVLVQEVIQDMDDQMIQRMRLHKLNPHYRIGVQTGLDELDEITDGLREGITTLAAATGMGKTGLALTIALNASRKGINREKIAPAHTHIFSGEMTQEQLNYRLLSMKTGIAVRTLERGAINGQEAVQYARAKQELMQHALSFESGKRMNILQIRQRVRQLVSQQALNLFVIDGLLEIDDLYMDDTDTKKRRRYMQDKRRDAIGETLKELEDIALSHHVAILLTHQTNRAPAARKDKRPVLSDMAEASFVERKSAVILFLYRDEYYNDETEHPNRAEIIVRKNRHGSPGTAMTWFERGRTLFLNHQVKRVDLTDL
jgi:replicative DNA helicase